MLAAAAEVTGQDQFVVIGSQAILGTYNEPPPSLLVSLEADIYPLHAPDAAAEVDGALGDGSPFHAAIRLLRPRRRAGDRKGAKVLAEPPRQTGDPTPSCLETETRRVVSRGPRPRALQVRRGARS